ncbi:MAG: ABC transporter permease [Bryobacteraceae bacterium]|nr:ABC transporter permease [Bryobacteraceae bacterium]
MKRISSFLRNILFSNRVDSDLSSELRSQLELLVEQKMAAGMDEKEARRAARAEFGGIDQVAESVRDVRIGIRFQQFCQDINYGARVLRRSPGFSVAAILVLSLAIGANTAMFSVIEGVLLRPLPYKDADRLCVLWKSIPQRNIEWDWTSALTVRDWRDQSKVFEDVALVLRPEGSKVTMPGDSGLEKVQGSIVSGNFFEVLGVRPLLGRTFSALEAERGDNVIVLSHGLWQQRFGADNAVLGRTVRIDDRSAAIIGVMPPSFEFPDKDAQLWLLLTADPRWPTFQMPRFRIADAFCGLGRLKPGRSVAQARAEMTTVAARLAQQYPATDQGLGVRVVPLFDQIAGPRVHGILWTLGAAVLCVLLIACSNLTSLLVARGAARRRELALRAALGAGRARLAAQLATESILLALAGGVGGILLAHTGLHFLLALAPSDLPRAEGIAMNGAVLGFSFGLCLLTGLACGLLPAWQLARTGAQTGLHEGGRGASSGPGVQRLRGVLVAAQYALAIILLTGAGLLVRSFLLLNSVDRGFDATHLLTVSVPLPYEKYKERARGQAFFDEAIERLKGLPGVREAATGSAVFRGFQGNAPNQNIVVEGQPSDQDTTLHARNVVSEEYFRLLGIPLLEGRLFSSQDTENTPIVAVINQKMARHYWPSQRAVGKRFKEVLPGTEGVWTTVIGVVKDVVYSRDGIVIHVFYPSARQWYTTDRQLVLRTTSDPNALTGAVRNVVQSIDRTLPRVAIATVENQLAEQDKPRIFQTGLIGIFAGLAVVLAATGLYGLMAYSVEQRTKEIGIRVALGSTRAGVALLVLKQGAAWGAGGIAIGIAGAVVFGRTLSASLYGMAPTDPFTLAAVTAALAMVTVLASAVPALRAGSVDPTVALRNE